MTITLTREEAQQVLDALNSCDETWVYDGEDEQIVDQYDHKLVAKALETLRTRLAQPEPEQLGEIVPADEEQLKRIAKLVAPEPEPVAWTVGGLITDFSRDFSAYKTKAYTRPLYTAPPQREWQGLTDEDIAEESGAAKAQNHMVLTLAEGFFCGARWAEAKLKEKNR